MTLSLEDHPTSRSESPPPPTPDPSSRAERLYAALFRFRWILSAVLLAGVLGLAAAGGGRVAAFSNGIASMGDTTNGSGSAPPLVFDPRMDLWFGARDEVVDSFHAIEERFVAEDYVMVAFEDTSSELGVFDRESLAAIARLTEGFLRVPGVRHVRSLTSNPWIRSGLIEDEAGDERGLLISDLVEGDPMDLTDDEVVERMIAVLGAARTAARLGEERVRAVLGEDARFADHIGEPLLLGTIVDETGTTTAIQVQVLRPRVEPEVLDEAFAHDPDKREVARTLHSVQAQRASLRGIEHVLRVERGLAVPTPELAGLAAWVESVPAGDRKEELRAELADPNRNFMLDSDGERVRKYFEYEPDGSGGWVDASDPAAVLEAPADFRPKPRSDYDYHVAGVPQFELNFEQVGMSDAKYMALMFVAIAVLLLFVFRSVFGLGASMIVVFGAIVATVTGAFFVGALMNNMTIVAPNMLTAVALGDSVHLVTSWSKLRKRSSSQRELMLEVLRRNALPVFLTSVTTSIGFLSLTISEMVPVSMFGAMCAFGTGVAWLLSMTIVPALLSLVRLPKQPEGGQPLEAAHRDDGWEPRLASAILARRKAILAGAAVLFAVSLYGLANLHVDSDFRAMFPEDNATMSDFNWIESRMGGVGDLEIVFDGGASDVPAPAREDARRLSVLRLQAAGVAAGEAGFEPLDDAERAELARLEAQDAAWQSRRIAVSADFLRDLDAFEQRLREEMADPESPMRVVTDLTSPLDILRQMHRVQHGTRAAYYRVPTEEDVPAELRAPELSFDPWTEEWLLVPAQSASTLAAQYYLQYENGARPGENLATQVSMDRTQFRVQGRLEQAPTEVTLAAVERIREIARTEFPGLTAEAAVTAPGTDGVERVAPKMNVSGKMFLFARTNRMFTFGFVKSMTIAVVAITLLIALIFRSARIALVSLVPNVLPILMPLSVFGLFGMPLDAPAIFVSSVALGVCVDDTLHFFTHFRRAQARGYDFEGSIRHVFETTGRAITITSVVLVMGFGALVMSDFSPNFMMGTLASSMIALAWVADLVVTPAVLSLLSPAGAVRPVRA